MSLVSINLFAMSVYGGILILIVLLLRQLKRSRKRKLLMRKP